MRATRAQAEGALLPPSQDWEMPAELTAVKRYMDTFMARDSWKHTVYSPEIVVQGWAKHGVQKLVPAK